MHHNIIRHKTSPAITQTSPSLQNHRNHRVKTDESHKINCNILRNPRHSVQKPHRTTHPLRVHPQRQQSCQTTELSRGRLKKADLNNFEGQKRKEYLIQMKVGKTGLEEVREVLFEYEHYAAHEEGHDRDRTASRFHGDLEGAEFIDGTRTRWLWVQENGSHFQGSFLRKAGCSGGIICFW